MRIVLFSLANIPKKEELEYISRFFTKVARSKNFQVTVIQTYMGSIEMFEKFTMSLHLHIEVSTYI